MPCATVRRDERFVKRAASHAQAGSGQQDSYARHERHRRTDGYEGRAIETHVTAHDSAECRRIDRLLRLRRARSANRGSREAVAAAHAEHGDPSGSQRRDPGRAPRQSSALLDRHIV